MNVDVKTDILLSMTAAMQQRDSHGLTQSNSYVKIIVQQALLTATPPCTTQQQTRWSKAAQELLSLILGQMSSTEVSSCQLACCLAAASLKACSVPIFVDHYNAIVVRALDQIRKQITAQAAKPQLWTIITAAFTRIEELVNVPGLRREASSLAGKLMAVLQPTLAAAGLAPTPGVDSHSVELLQGVGAGLQALPTAFRTHQKALGHFAAGLLASPLLPSVARSEAARIYSLLPRLTGDAEIWSRHMQNVLCACHTRLDIAYLGMDDSTLAASAKAALDPQADPLMAPLPDSKPAQHSAAGQHSRVAGQSVHSVASVRAASCQLAGFLDVLERLLTVSYPVAVPIPAHGILMLLTRILSFDDTARQAAALPALHTCALQLVQTLLWASQGSLLLHYTPMAHMLTNLLRQIAASNALDAAPAATVMRQQVYKTASELVERGGLGVAALLGPQAVPCALLELYGCKPGKKRAAEEGLPNGHLPKKQKKNKKDDQLPSFESMMEGSSAEGIPAAATQQAGSSSSSFDVNSAAAQEAVLRLLEALLQAWGSGMTQQQRIQIDSMTAHIASSASLAVHHMSQSFEGGCNQAGALAVQLAAMKALLASVLCPAPHRPTFLPQALSLFTQGLQSPAPQIAHFSQQALLAVEGLIHPRAGQTTLQPHRLSGNPHPYLSTSTTEQTDLGKPKLWSAVLPAAHASTTATITGADTAKLPTNAASMAMAQEVLQAGQIYSAAVAKLQAKLSGASEAGDPQPASQEKSMAAHTNGQQHHGGVHWRHDSTVAGAAAGATASTDAALAAAVPADAPASTTDLANMNQQVRHAPMQINENAAAAHSAQHSVPASAVPQPGKDTVNARDEMHSGETDDGYISLEHQPMATKGAAFSSELPEYAERPKVTAEYVQAAAESSDSQGSLPEIDSGGSSDSSDSPGIE